MAGMDPARNQAPSQVALMHPLLHLLEFWDWCQDRLARYTMRPEAYAEYTRISSDFVVNRDVSYYGWLWRQLTKLLENPDYAHLRVYWDVNHALIFENVAVVDSPLLTFPIALCAHLNYIPNSAPFGVFNALWNRVPEVDRTGVAQRACELDQACQQEIAYNWEVVCQQRLTRLQQAARQQQVARQQEITRQQALAREMARQQALEQERERARLQALDQERARQQALEQEMARQQAIEKEWARLGADEQEGLPQNAVEEQQEEQVAFFCLKQELARLRVRELGPEGQQALKQKMAEDSISFVVEMAIQEARGQGTESQEAREQKMNLDLKSYVKELARFQTKEELEAGLERKRVKDRERQFVYRALKKMQKKQDCKQARKGPGEVEE